MTMSESVEEGPECRTVKTLFSFDTEYSADSVEWCPHAPCKNVFVCGNYQLAASEGEGTGGGVQKGKRLGRILLFSIAAEYDLKLHQTIDTAAVLDLKWCHVRINDDCLLGVTNAAKTIEIYKLDVEDIRLTCIAKHTLTSEEDLLILSLDWSTGKLPSETPNIVASDSKGNVSLFQLFGNRLNILDTWHSHDYEAWIAGFYYWNPNIIFSGGDDSMFLKFDVRVGKEPVSRNRSHDAGVTSFHSNGNKEFICVSGSYDSQVRFWDIRTMKVPLSVLKMPGTLWRLKWDPFSRNHILAACMLGGAHIIADVDRPKIIDSCYEHQNITYGADWCYLNESEVKTFADDGNCIIGTCSFYDHLLCVSKLTLPS